MSKFVRRRLYSKIWLRDHSPSRRDGLSYEKEEEYRQAYVQLLVDVGHKLGVSSWAVATAIIYCHRFWTCKSMTSNDRFVIAQAAFFLAAKVEEESRDLGVVVRAFWEHLHRPRAGSPDDQRRLKRQQIQDERFLEAAKLKVLTGERALLFALSFDLAPCQPHHALVALLQECGWAGAAADGDAPADDQTSVLTQAAWNFLNDSLKTTVTLQATADEIACGVMLLTARLFGRVSALTDADGHALWDKRDVAFERLQGVIEEVLSVYDMPDGIVSVALGLAPATGAAVAPPPLDDSQ